MDVSQFSNRFGILYQSGETQIWYYIIFCGAFNLEGMSILHTVTTRLGDSDVIIGRIEYLAPFSILFWKYTCDLNFSLNYFRSLYSWFMILIGYLKLKDAWKQTCDLNFSLICFRFSYKSMLSSCSFMSIISNPKLNYWCMKIQMIDQIFSLICFRSLYSWFMIIIGNLKLKMYENRQIISIRP